MAVMVSGLKSAYTSWQQLTDLELVSIVQHDIYPVAGEASADFAQSDKSRSRTHV
jgi:hypothetical protein